MREGAKNRIIVTLFGRGRGNMMSLEAREDRVELLKAGYTGKAIEQLFIYFNGFEVVEVNWLPCAP